MSPLMLAKQVLLYGVFFAVVGYFSMSPAYEHTAPDAAIVKLSFSHGSARKQACRRFSAEEIAALPPDQRRPNDCARERVPVLVELYLDGELMYQRTLAPAGIARDGPASVYQHFEVQPGRHTVKARMRDTPREQGFDYETEHTVQLEPLEILVIDFHAESGAFVFL